MAHPRRIIPGDTYLITRRCSHRTFRLRPCAETNRIFMYCLALACRKTGVLIHAACVMSNHHHLVVTDPAGVLPDFLRELHRLTAKAMNASQGQWENLWAAEPCNVVRLTTDEDVDDRIAYVIANPVTAGLVRRPAEWPGFLAWGEKALRTQRPTPYFREAGECPPELRLTFTRPLSRAFAPPAQREWRERIAKVVAEKVRVACEAMRAEGRHFLGRAVVLASSFVRRALSYEQKRGIIPTFAAKARSIRDELRRTERRFRAKYRAALEQWRAGVRSVVFPFGTWGRRINDVVAVEPPLAA